MVYTFSLKKKKKKKARKKEKRLTCPNLNRSGIAHNYKGGYVFLKRIILSFLGLA
jgi:hypothetical protein